MKIIDEKGKLFGIVNLLDLVVVIIIIGVLAIAITTITKNKTTYLQTGQKTEMDVTVVCRMVEPSVADAIQVGQSLLAQNAYTGGTVKEIVSIEPALMVNVDAQGNTIQSANPYYKDVTVVLTNQSDPTSPVLKINGQECRVNGGIWVKTQVSEMSGKIKKIEFPNYTQK